MSRRVHGLALGLGCLLVGCTFNGSGVTVQLPDRPLLPRDLGRPDLVSAEGLAPDAGNPAELGSPDRYLPDLARPDTTAADLWPLDLPPPPPDQRQIMPISASALGTALFNATVPCVMKDGSMPGTNVRVADSATVTFFDGTNTLAGAGSATISWVGSRTSVVVVWNPNACDQEDPGGGAEWQSAGLLIRGATLGNGQLLLQAGLTANDINMLNVEADGAFQGETFGADDATLSSWPPLVNGVNEAKKLILQLGNVI